MKNEMMTEEMVVEKLACSARFVERSVVNLYYLQTRDERQVKGSVYRNWKGFNIPDSRRCSFYAEWVMAGNKLRQRDLDTARRCLYKYRRQIAAIENGEVEFFYY